jgi:sugar phosphate isomerase/epimerase
LDLVNFKVKEFDIKVAIHNHGPGDERYPSPESIYSKVKDLDPRMGICMDIGHTMRLGLDPCQETEKYADRLHDIHIKDVSLAAAAGETVEMGRGVIDLPKFFRTLLKINYQGVASFEYEKDAEDPLPGLAESVGYVRGVLSVV